MNPILAGNQGIMTSKIKAMYKLYQGDPQGFVNQAINSNPQIASVLKMATNPSETFHKMLSQYGMTEDDFRKMLES